MKIPARTLWAIAALALLNASIAAAAIPTQERAALEAIYQALDGPNWQSKQNWRGVLPREIGDLSNLEVFQADGSTISGPLPSEIGRLSKLRILNFTGFYDQLGLNGNEISGALPRARAVSHRQQSHIDTRRLVS